MARGRTHKRCEQLTARGWTYWPMMHAWVKLNDDGTVEANYVDNHGEEVQYEIVSGSLRVDAIEHIRTEDFKRETAKD